MLVRKFFFNFMLVTLTLTYKVCKDLNFNEKNFKFVGGNLDSCNHAIKYLHICKYYEMLMR